MGLSVQVIDDDTFSPWIMLNNTNRSLTVANFLGDSYMEQIDCEVLTKDTLSFNSNYYRAGFAMLTV